MRLNSALVKLFVLGGAALSIGVASSAHAQSSAAAETYAPDYFSQYAPRTALDMVRRVPGFSIQGGNGGERGLGQGGANVLINGARISGKSVSARDALERIPADTVLSIEIVDGASLSIAGLSGQVANILTDTKALSGTWEWNPELRQTQEPNLLRGKASVTGQKGRLKYTASLDANAFRGGGDGPETLTGIDGVTYEFADERGRSSGQRPRGALALTWDHDPERAVNFNLAYEQFNFNRRSVSNRAALTPRGTTQIVNFDGYEDEKNGEVSADYKFPLDLPILGNGSLKLIGVASFEDSPSRAQSISTSVDGERLDQIQFFTQADEGERIARAEYSLSPNSGGDWQASVETAFNYLDVTNRLFEFNGAGLTETVLDDPSVRVEEKRAELTLTHSRKISDKLDMQVSIGAERSELSQSGVSAQVREFVRPKGFVNLAYAVDDSFKLRLEIDRRVGQLRFFDFISSLNVSEDTEQASNPELVPQQFWNLAAEFDKDFGQGNTVLLRLFYEDIDDLVDRVPVGVSGDAVGNIPKASAIGAILNTTFKGERWGWDGAQLDLEYIVQTSEVKDPVTETTRQISRRNQSLIEIDFRHDIPSTDWAYGFGIERFRNARRYGIEDVSRDYFTGPFSYIFAEHKDVMGVTAQVRFLNLFGVEEGFERTVYNGRRSPLTESYHQAREYKFGRIIRMTFSGTF